MMKHRCSPEWHNVTCRSMAVLPSAVTATRAKTNERLENDFLTKRLFKVGT